MLDNPNIKLVRISVLSYKTAYKKIIFYFYKKLLSMPRPGTVLHGALFLAISMNYEKIYLAGADSDWHKNIEVNNLSNKLERFDPHFYSSDNRILYDNNASINLGSYLYNLSTVFNSYYLISLYSNYMNIEIINITRNSSIDCFTRSNAIILNK
jgi:hypothetical protein